MKIDYVITDLAIGGAEIQVVMLLEKLVQRGHSARLTSLLPPEAFTERLEKAGVTVCSLGMRSAFGLPFALFRLLRLFKQSPPDVVHGHMVHANILLRLARLFRPSLKIVCTAHNIHEGGAWRDWAYRITNGLCQKNTTISESATQRFVGAGVFPRDNTSTIFNGIELDAFCPADGAVPEEKENPSPFVWIAVGRLVEQKDYPTLLAAFARLGDGVLKIVGDGALKDALRDSVDCSRLGARVSFLGTRSDLPELYRQADGFVLSSAWEGYGLVVAEAMASGLPVVVTASGGPQEIVGSDGEAGLVVPLKDPVKLAEAMTQIMALSKAARVEMGLRGRQRIQERFSIEQIVAQWVDVYQSL